MHIFVDSGRIRWEEDRARHMVSDGLESLGWAACTLDNCKF